MAHTAIGDSSLGHTPRGDRWEFDESVTHVFADMLARSIPQYEVMRRTVFDIGSTFVRPGTQIVDLGCARGDALAPFIAEYGPAHCYVGVDISPPMLRVAKDRFATHINDGIVQIIEKDLRHSYPEGSASLTLGVLTLQFIPLDHRQRILRDVFLNTAPGGAFILVEKLLASSAHVGRIMVEQYHAHKTARGYTFEEIERKRLALEGVLVPVTARWNEDMLANAGFQELECFWRWMNFGGWVAVRRD